MTDKVQKIREIIEIVVNRRLNLLNGDYFDLNKETGGFTNEIMNIIDSIQEEPNISPVFDEGYWERLGEKSASEEIGDYDHKAVMEALHPELKEEPVSEELEEASYRFACKCHPLKTECSTSSPNPEVKDAFKAGAKWQKEQDNKKIKTAIDFSFHGGRYQKEEEMLKNAIDATCFGFQGDALFSFKLPADKYLVGSKVKVIVINEEYNYE